MDEGSKSRDPPGASSEFEVLLPDGSHGAARAPTDPYYFHPHIRGTVLFSTWTTVVILIGGSPLERASNMATSPLPSRGSPTWGQNVLPNCSRTPTGTGPMRRAKALVILQPTTFT